MRAAKGYWDLPAVVLVGVLVAGAAVRLYFSEANSYWLDELYSVFYYGVAHESLASVINQVSRSIQLPLYQVFLYYWMSIFGDSEVATRSLSNLYIVGATFCLYLAVRRVYGPWLGVIVALVFTLMFTPTYYGMETRGYAQSIFLSSLSTLLLTYALPRFATKPWRELARDGWLYALVAANTALLMTHYYNVLFLAAQGVFLIIYLQFRSDGAIDAVIKSVVVALTPVVVLLAIWGPFMLRSYGRTAQKYVVEGTPLPPWETLSDLVIQPNFTQPYFVHLVAALVGWVAVVSLARLLRGADDETLFTVWFILATAAPAFLAFLLFLVSGHERYSSRYFSFSVGPLAVVVVVGIYQIVSLAGRGFPAANRVTLLVTALLAALLVAPGGAFALMKTKADWRGIADKIVLRINQEPNKRFVVYETTFKKFPTLDFYLRRYSDSIRVDDVLQRGFEKVKKPLQFEAPDADYAIVAFTHQRTSDFPRTLEVLHREMTLVEEHLDEKNRGYLVFAPQ